MKRVYRMFAPAMSFAAVGGIVLLIARADWLHVRGGDPVVSAYAFSWQLLLSVLLITSIDDFGSPFPRSSAARPVGLPYYSFRRALLDYYRSRFTAMLFLSFGIGASTSIPLAFLGRPLPGVCRLGYCADGRECLLAGAIVISAVALTLLRVSLPALAGWCCGYSLAVALVEKRFPSFNYLNPGSFGLAVAVITLLLAVRAAILLVGRVRRRQPVLNVAGTPPGFVQ